MGCLCCEGSQNGDQEGGWKASFRGVNLLVGTLVGGLGVGEAKIGILGVCCFCIYPVRAEWERARRGEREPLVGE